MPTHTGSYASSNEPPTLAAYEQELATAQDRLDREVTPLRTDLAAWLAFLDAYAAHPKPFEMLQASTLGMNDIARLGRAWDRRMKQDPSIEKRIAELRKGPALELPAITVKPAVLKPSSGAAKIELPADLPTEPAPKPAMTADLGMEIMPAICALEELSPPDLLERLRGYGINSPEERAHRHQRWAQEFSRDPSLKRTLRVLVEHRKQMFGARMATRSTTPEKQTSRPATMPVKAPSVRVIEASPPNMSPPLPSVKVAPPALAGTMLPLEAPKREALPFKPGSPSVSSTPSVLMAKVPPAASGLDRVCARRAQGEALPFKQAPSTRWRRQRSAQARSRRWLRRARRLHPPRRAPNSICLALSSRPRP